MQREAVLTRLITASSREGTTSSPLPVSTSGSPHIVAVAAESCRVQDRIVEHGRDVQRLIVDRNAVVYVCGYHLTARARRLASIAHHSPHVPPTGQRCAGNGRGRARGAGPSHRRVWGTATGPRGSPRRARTPAAGAEVPARRVERTQDRRLRGAAPVLHLRETVQKQLLCPQQEGGLVAGGECSISTCQGGAMNCTRWPKASAAPSLEGRRQTAEPWCQRTGRSGRGGESMVGVSPRVSEAVAGPRRRWRRPQCVPSLPSSGLFVTPRCAQHSTPLAGWTRTAELRCTRPARVDYLLRVTVGLSSPD